MFKLPRDAQRHPKDIQRHLKDTSKTFKDTAKKTKSTSDTVTLTQKLSYVILKHLLVVITNITSNCSSYLTFHFETSYYYSG